MRVEFSERVIVDGPCDEYCVFFVTKVDAEDEDAGETKQDEDEGDDEDGDPTILACTEEEIQKSKAYMKDRVKDKTQAMLDEMRESVDDTVRIKPFVGEIHRGGECRRVVQREVFFGGEVTSGGYVSRR